MAQKVHSQVYYTQAQDVRRDTLAQKHCFSILIAKNKDDLIF